MVPAWPPRGAGRPLAGVERREPPEEAGAREDPLEPVERVPEERVLPERGRAAVAMASG